MILILNNKANLTLEEIKYYEKKLRKYNVIVCPSICYLPLFQKGKYILGSQDISEFVEENRTGEINGKQLKSLNVKYCLIGHSERRLYNKETNDTLLNKIIRCFENNIVPLYCIGETNNENKELELKQELDLVLNNFKEKEIYIIYEPLNNIGNENPNLNSLEETINFIKQYIKEKNSNSIKLIYGGGVNKDNIKLLTKIKELDGLIISTNSLKVDSLKALYEKTRK